MKVNKIDEKLREYEQKGRDHYAGLTFRREAARENLKAASGKMELADDPDEYAQAVADVAKYKAEIDFYNKQIEKPTPVIKAAEYEELAQELKAAAGELVTKAKPEIEKKYNELLKAFSNVYAEVYKLNDLYCRLGTAAGKSDYKGVATPALGMLKDNDPTPFSFDKICLYYAEELARDSMLKPHGLGGRYSQA